MSAADQLRARFTDALNLDGIALDDDSMLDDDARAAIADALIASGVASELIVELRALPIELIDAQVEILGALSDALARSATANEALDDRSLSIIRAALLATTLALDEGSDR